MLRCKIVEHPTKRGRRNICDKIRGEVELSLGFRVFDQLDFCLHRCLQELVAIEKYHPPQQQEAKKEFFFFFKELKKSGFVGTTSEVSAAVVSVSAPRCSVARC